RYLPSKQFSLIAVSLFLSAGLVFAADYVTGPSSHNSLFVDMQANAQKPAAAGSWQDALAAGQDNSGLSLPPVPDQNTVDALLQAAQSNNLTQSISRSLLVNLVSAKGQGLGSDIPTQNELVAQALAQVPASADKKTYYAEDLTLSDNSSASLHAYG